MISEEEKLKGKLATKVDAETQTDPDLTGVDADDFEEDDDGEEESEESGSENSEEGKDGEGEEAQSNSVDKGTSSKSRLKIIAVKYYFGEDLPDAKLDKRKYDFDHFAQSTW